jgi:hypothetical protein
MVKFGLRLLAVLVGVSIVLGVLELYYRSVAEEEDLNAVRGLYVLDQYTSHSLKPNLRRVPMQIRVKIGGDTVVKPFFVSTTSDGIRSARDVAVERKPNAIRIMVMGSSFDFGYGVNDEDTWAAVLENRLASDRIFPVAVEVINGGMPGTHNEQFLIRYLSRLQKYQADAVILATGPTVPSGSTDMRTYRLPAPDPDFAATSAFYIDGDGILRAHVTPAPLLRALSSRSQLVRQTLIRINVTRSNRELVEARTIAASEVHDSSLDPLVAFYERLRDQDVPLYVVIRETLLGNRDTPSPEEIMARKLERRGIPSLNLRPLFDRQDYGSFLVPDGHWNEAAHRMAADAIATFIAARRQEIADAARRHGWIASH